MVDTIAPCGVALCAEHLEECQGCEYVASCDECASNENRFAAELERFGTATITADGRP
jgi:hypothetical protein